MKRSGIITIIIILLLIAFFYFFNPACKFHRVGTTFEGQDSNEVCYCKFIGGYCVRSSSENLNLTDEELKQKMDEMFSNK